MTYLLLFLAVMIGYVTAIFLNKRAIKNMDAFMAFSGAFLLSITVFELLPHVFESPDKKQIGVYIMGGVLLQIFLEFFSKGAEHGHLHFHSENTHFPWVLFISLGIHAFMEGFPIAEHSNLLLAVIVHKIPVAIILSFFFISAGYKTTTTLTFMILFALMTPLGSFLSQYDFAIEYEPQITSVVIGIFLHVSTTILFESSKNHKFDLKKVAAVLTAVVIAYFL